MHSRENSSTCPQFLRLHMLSTAELTAPYSLLHDLIPSVNQRPLHSHVFANHFTKIAVSLKP